jgi:uncharacterized protein (DUF2141 family)
MSRVMLALVGALTTTPATAASLVVRVEGVAEDGGEIRVAVCDRGFVEAGCPVGARRMARASAEEFRFEGLKPGSYAVAVYQDANGNGELDRVPPGLPIEPYGFSNDVGRFGPPSFERAVVPVLGEDARVVVSLGRLFGAG